jgi:hypothetical protein
MAVGVRRFTPSRVTRRFGAFAVLTSRAIEKVRPGKMTAAEAAGTSNRWPGAHRLRETGHYDPKLVDMFIARVQHQEDLTH